MFRSALIVAMAARQTVAWGNLGHETIGYIAQQVRTSSLAHVGCADAVVQFLAPNALSFVQSSLGSAYSESLGVAATACGFMFGFILGLIMLAVG